MVNNEKAQLERYLYSYKFTVLHILLKLHFSLQILLIFKGMIQTLDFALSPNPSPTVLPISMNDSIVYLIAQALCKNKVSIYI